MVSTVDREVWSLPNVTTDDSGITVVDFRDCIIEIAEGLVHRYFDKMHSVYLCPGDGFDSWAVYSEAGQATGQSWRGIIAFDGSQLLIQQARNALFRLYRTDGTIETQLRTTRILERPGYRSLVFPRGDYIEEELTTGRRRMGWGDRTVMREAGGECQAFDRQGNQLESAITVAEGAAVGEEVINAFTRSLLNWEQFSATTGDGEEFYFGGPPGFVEAAPGEFFCKPCTTPDKPDDLREVITHDFADGTVLHEYIGRLNGVPFLGHELVTHQGLVLARMVEYDQPKSITFVDPRGVIREFPAVQMVEMQYDPNRMDYVTCITDPQGVEFINPKGAQLDRGE